MRLWVLGSLCHVTKYIVDSKSLRLAVRCNLGQRDIIRQSGAGCRGSADREHEGQRADSSTILEMKDGGGAVAEEVAAKTVTEVILEGRGVLHFECDWGVGIGGGLWSTGILLTQHLCQHAALYDGVFRGKRVLELGSGTGLVGVAAARFGPPAEVVITDLESHLDICRKNVTRNVEDNETGSCPVKVQAYDWTEKVPAELGAMPFDIILGTDVAYYEHLYTPFIEALDRTAGPDTLILLGVTRTDTGPDFFDALDKAGFEYNLVDQATHKGFGLFTVCRERPDED
eukprot:jgi/Undpi1/1962/HiC_scaffold_12.g05349.m1